MSRTQRRAGSSLRPAFPAPAFPATLLVAAVLAAAIPEAYGQQATPANPASSTPASGTANTPPASSTGANNASPAPASSASATKGSQTTGPHQAAASTGQTASPQQAGGSATGSRQASASDKPGKPPPVCFKLTGRCVEGSKGPGTKAGTASTPKDGSTQRPLNLNAPDVRTVVSADELKEPLPADTQITETQEDQTVSIKGEGVPADVPLGFGAIWWALNHPSQAWRIVAPAE